MCRDLHHRSNRDHGLHPNHGTAHYDLRTSAHKMTYDHWKTTNPADEWLGPEPDMNDTDMRAMWPYEDEQTRANYEAAQTKEQKETQERVEQAIVSLILALGDLIRLGQDGGYGFQIEYRERKHIETALSDLACLCACLKIAPKIPAVS